MAGESTNSRLTSVQIRLQNNQFTEEIPISVLASNIIYDPGGGNVSGGVNQGYSLVETLGNVNMNTLTGGGSLQSQIDSLKTGMQSSIRTIALEELPIAVSNWLSNNYSAGSENISTDKSLTIEDAVADAKAAGDLIKVSDSQPTERSNKVWIKPSVTSVTVPTMQDIENIVAPQYSDSSPYNIGDYVIHNDLLYKCTTAIGSSGESWTSGHWTQVNVGNQLKTIPAVDSTLTVSGKAADAAAVGDAISDLESAMPSTAEIEEIRAVGAQVLESIPADYTELSEDVGNLKSEINELDEATESIFDSWLANNVSLTENQNKLISIVSLRVIDAGGAFYVSDAIPVSEGDVYKISCSGYGNAAAYAFGNNDVLSSVFPSATASTSETHLYVDKNIIIPAGVTELYLAKYTGVSATMSCAKLVNMPQMDTIALSETYSETYAEIPATNPVRVPVIYNFENGKTYKIKLTATDVNLQTGVTNQVLVDSSTRANTSVSTLVDRLLTSGPANSVVSGTSWTIDYTPTIDGIVSLLLRYKTSTGTQIFDVEISAIDTLATVLDTVDNVANKITQIPNQSRMQFGAHRGAESFAPPNSVAAYEIAGKMGFQWAWLAQIRWSANKTLYVMHDEDVSITTNGTGNLSELSDDYIDSLLCNKLSGYDYSQFSEADLRVPTLEKVIQICVKYGMKMCFRIEPFPSDMDTDDNALIWSNFANLIKEYNITDGIYSGYNSAEMKLCRTLIGENENLCPFRGIATSGQDYINFFNSSGITGKRSVLLYYQNATFADIKLLHKNGIEVYVFYNGTRPTMEEVDQWASWGVEILQNPRIPKLTIDT